MSSRPGAKFTNRLSLETSPYLLQHAHNPVDWYPWGKEAFDAARTRNVPILLSIGYSTCHWCHVMEEESFEDEEIAKRMNENYVCIKVDREERPDVDAIYMAAVQALTGSGGWPMTVWLTPDQEPFYAATYIPARDGDRGARTGFFTILSILKTAFDAEPDRVGRSATKLVERIHSDLSIVKSQKTGGAMQFTDQLALEILDHATNYYMYRFDSADGGLDYAPKFPSSFPIRFLLREARRTGNQPLLQMVQLTLDKMACGGIYDQIAGGFHRYSTDAHWMVPHFEKMLYDNALLVLAYLEGFQATGNENLSRIACEVLEFIEREMTSPSGTFYSATDADSLNLQGVRDEGFFFTWTPHELDGVLGADRAQMVGHYYGVTKTGNFEGRNILHARELTAVPTHIQDAKVILRKARETRPLPMRDEKILVSWNALMISAYAKAGFILNQTQYVEKAGLCAEFILNNLTVDGRLLHSYKDGKQGHTAFLDDYAFFISGLLDLYEVTGNLKWILMAKKFDKILETEFEDLESGGFFMTGTTQEKLIAREKPAYDGAEPCGNSVAVSNLFRLHALTTGDRYRQRAERALNLFAEIMVTSPSALSEMLLSVHCHVDKLKEIVIVVPRSRAEAEIFLKELRQAEVPNSILVVAVEGADLQAQSKVIPLLDGKMTLNGKPTAYICEHGTCKAPTNDPQTFNDMLRNLT